MLRLMKKRNELIEKRKRMKGFLAKRDRLRNKVKRLNKKRDDAVEAAEDATDENRIAELEEETESLLEELTATETELVEVEEEIVAIEDVISEIVDEIEKIEEELDMDGAVDPDVVENELGNVNPDEGMNLAGKRKKLVTHANAAAPVLSERGFFRHIGRERAVRMMARAEVKGFLADVREKLWKQNRAVKGAELTIPDVMLETLRDNLHRYSKLIGYVMVRKVSGTARQNIVGEVPEAIWTEMCAKLNELDFLFNQNEVDGYKVGGFIPICNSTLEDSDEYLASEILDMLGQSIGMAVDKAILYGKGTKMPLGIVTRLAQTAKPSNWNDNAPEWVDLHSSNIIKMDPEAYASNEEFYAAFMINCATAKANYSNGTKFWAMNELTHAKMMAKTLTFNAAGALVAAVNNTLPVITGDVVELPFIPDGDIAGGYGSIYLLAERAGATFAQSEHVQFIEDNTVFKGTARYDGIPHRGEGFVLMNIENVDPTTSLTFAADAANAPTP